MITNYLVNTSTWDLRALRAQDGLDFASLYACEQPKGEQPADGQQQQPPASYDGRLQQMASSVHAEDESPSLQKSA